MTNKYTMHHDNDGHPFVKDDEGRPIAFEMDGVWKFVKNGTEIARVYFEGEQTAEAIGKYHEPLSVIHEYVFAPTDTWNRNLDAAPRDGTRVDLWVNDVAGERRLPDYCYDRHCGVPGFWYESDGGPNKIHQNNIIAWRPVPDGPKS